MIKKYDVFVIGTGVAGSKIASACAKAGKKVGIVDYRDYGGTCGLRGCNPKKVLSACAEVISRVNEYNKKGIIKGQTIIDWEKLIDFKDTFVKDIPDDKEKDFSSKNIAMYHGKAKFISPNKLKIKDDIIEADKIVIASGAKPRPLGITGEDYLITSEDFMKLNNLPKNILFIGGGFISFELANIAASMASKITILERSDKALANFDSDLVQLLLDKLQEKGIDIVFNKDVEKIQRSQEKYIVTDKEGQVYSTDLVVHGAGRLPQINNLDLEKAGIKSFSKGIPLNSFLQARDNNSIFVVGDAVSKPESLPLTPVASLEAKVVIHNILEDDMISPNYAGTTSVLYTFPLLARVGMLEEEAKNNNIDFWVKYSNTSKSTSTQRLALDRSGYKVLINKNNSKIIGAHLLGHHVEEVINIFSIAIRKGLTAEELRETIWSYPSVSDTLDDILDLS